MYEASAGPLIAAGSGALLFALGVLVLQKLKSRQATSLAFAGFAIVWGLQLVSANLSRMALFAGNVTGAYGWSLVFLSLLVVLPVPLLFFAFRYPWPTNRLGRLPEGPIAIAVPSLLALILLWQAPDLFVAITETSGGQQIEIGPLLAPLSATVSILAFAAALVVFQRNLLESTGKEEADRLALVVSGLLLYLSNRAGLLVDRGLLRRSQFQAAGFESWLYGIGAAAVALILTAWVVAKAYTDPDLPRRQLMLGAGLVPFVVTTIGGFVRAGGYPAFDTVGLWRIGMVALFAYAIARHEMFDLELRLRDATPVAAYVIVLAAAGGILWLGLGEAFSGIPWLGATASIGLAAVCWPTIGLTDSLLGRHADHVDEPEYLYKRKLEIYRGALEEAQARGMGTESEQMFLSDLRRRLEISEEEHRILLMVLESQDRYGDRPEPPEGEKFEVLEELGRGTFGRARLARDTSLDRRVVLKEPTGPWLFDDEGRDLFVREAKIAARISHPNVVQVYEVLRDRDPPALVLEYVDGGSLQDRVEEAPLEPEQALEVIEDVLAGLARIHDEGIIHRDIKPGNILMATDGTAKLTDFGVAHPPDDVQLKATLATGGSQPGTVAYMSPEQVQGEALDERSDLYAVGAVLYYALTGDHYLGIAGVSEVEARRRIREERPALDDDRIPPRIRSVLEEALAKEPEERLASVDRMRKLLSTEAAAFEPG